MLQCTCPSFVQTLCISKGTPKEHSVPYIPTPNLTIQIIEITFKHDKYTIRAIEAKNNIKNDNYDPLIEAIKAQGWKVNLFVV